MVGWPEILKRENLAREGKKCIRNRLMTTESHMEQLILKHSTEEDSRRVWIRKTGGGAIGGRACDLLVARKLVELSMSEYVGHVEPHNSFFIGTDVFYRYLVYNHCAELKARYRLKKEYFKETEELTKRLRGGSLPEDIHEELSDMLGHYGTTPVIVRSSSITEDGHGDAFSGKYESIFCMNQGTKEERVEELEEVIRRVYASTMNEQAIKYRRERHLLGVDEQMALLTQQVAGQQYGDLYMPVAVGMGCSYNPYRWMKRLSPEVGMLRMVMGLGTRAVERTPGDYPHLIGLDRAQANLRTALAERHKFFQRKVDVLDFGTKSLCTKSLEKTLDLFPKWQKKMVLSRDTDAEDMLAERHIYRTIYFGDCQGLVDNPEFIRMMRTLMKMLGKEYERPVDVEFAVTSPEEGMWGLNLLQCRPLQTAKSEQVHIPDGVGHEFLFDVRRTSIRRSKEEPTDYIVQADPQKHYEYEYAKKPNVARLISRINQHLEDTDKKLILLTPGRIGTSSPELGVPVVYAGISQFSAICEVAYGKVGYYPDLSYGSHTLQDMVEADAYYDAINDNSKTGLHHPELLARYPEVLKDILSGESQELVDIVKIHDVSRSGATLTLDAQEGCAVCRIHGEQQTAER